MLISPSEGFDVIASSGCLNLGKIIRVHKLCFLQNRTMCTSVQQRLDDSTTTMADLTPAATGVLASDVITQCLRDAHPFLNIESINKIATKCLEMVEKTVTEQ